jgi:DNA repair protein RadC
MSESKASLESVEQRLVEAGWPGLGDRDLLALLLAPNQSWSRAAEQARRLRDQVGSLRVLWRSSYPELRSFGCSHRQAMAVLAAREIHRRSGRRMLPAERSFRCSADIFEYFRPATSELQQECFWVLLLDGKNRVMRVIRISEGSLTRSLVHPREVFRPAIREAAAGILFVHNHPSGAPEPSQEDIMITRRLVDTGKIIGIRVLDHVILGSFRYFSFADEGML